MRATIVVAILVAVTSAAHAYPQFQLSKDQTCSDCHLSPAGGGLLNENGLNTAESISQFGTNPAFANGVIPTPSWLELGGDFRGAGGYYGGPNASTVLFPMQAELYVAATVQNFSLHVTGGLRDPQYGNETDTLFSSREHWLQWQQNEGSPDGLFVRVGRFMPVFGLRFVEHPDYTRRDGGTPLYGEAYGTAIEYIDPRWEVHATGFIHDPIFPDSIERGNGATLYAETRITPTTSIGVEGKYDVTPDDKKYYGGITAKQYIDNLLIEFEGQVIHQKIDLGGFDDQLVGYLLGSYFLPHGIMIDLGLEAYEPDVRVRNLSQEAIDLNVHWFATSHIEVLLTNEIQMCALGECQASTGYSLVQLHYRL